jgi:biotin-(acetyl-CoA carboxylase) ligase
MFSNNQQFIGKGCGISEDGGLILELESGQTQTFYSGVLDFER